MPNAHHVILDPDMPSLAQPLFKLTPKAEKADKRLAGFKDGGSKKRIPHYMQGTTNS